MMGARDMQRYIILKSIKYARNDKDLEKFLQRAKVSTEKYQTDCMIFMGKIIPKIPGERPLRSRYL